MINFEVLWEHIFSLKNTVHTNPLYNDVIPFHATDLFQYPLKISENQRFSDVFWGYGRRPVTWHKLGG